MSLAAFQFIYWWEWTHRFLGRLLGAVFLLPFIFFAATGAIPRSRWPRMAFAVRARRPAGFCRLVDGGERPGSARLRQPVPACNPSPASRSCSSARCYGRRWSICADRFRPRLNFLPHEWGRWREAPEGGEESHHDCPLHLATLGTSSAYEGGKLWFAWGFVALVYAQMLLGALVAGLHAGLIYNTWPSMDGRVLPRERFRFASMVDQFLRECRARAVRSPHVRVCRCIGRGGIVVGRAANRAKRRCATREQQCARGHRPCPDCSGIATLLNQSPLALAASHQAGAVALLAAGLWNVFEHSRAAPHYTADASA